MGTRCSDEWAGREEGRRIREAIQAPGRETCGRLTMRLVRRQRQSTAVLSRPSRSFFRNRAASATGDAKPSVSVTQATRHVARMGQGGARVLEGLCRTLDGGAGRVLGVDAKRDMHLVTSGERAWPRHQRYDRRDASQVTYAWGGMAGRVWESGAPVSCRTWRAASSARSGGGCAAGMHGMSASRVAADASDRHDLAPHVGPRGRWSGAYRR